MRLGFALVGLLIALAIVATLVKKQLGATRIAVPPAAQGQGAPGQQLQQQVKQQMDALMQQPRAMPDDAQ
ncbi:MAG: hypothetical protein JSR53_08585 [Proteobacteria bacterium]|nr:hypothetical protein [Pseudomonadota bacterium]